MEDDNFSEEFKNFNSNLSFKIVKDKNVLFEYLDDEILSKFISKPNLTNSELIICLRGIHKEHAIYCQNSFNYFKQFHISHQKEVKSKEDQIKKLNNKKIELEKKLEQYDSLLKEAQELRSNLQKEQENVEKLQNEFDLKKFERMEAFNFVLRLIKEIYSNLNIFFMEGKNTSNDLSAEANLLSKISDDLKRLMINTKKQKLN
jgi:predicted nuclease with TOPRIM domain